MGKRLFDCSFAGIALLLCLPVLLLVAVAIKFLDPGPVFFGGPRVGKDGVVFTMWKFRTMTPQAAQTGPALTAGGDPRVTPLGRRLRKWKIDELPQLFNVLVGEMSVVGPRPEAPAYVHHYTPDQRAVLRALPGITGPSQIDFRHEESLLAGRADAEACYIREIMPRKLALDLEYIRHHTLWGDIRLIARTVACLFARPRSAGEERAPAGFGRP